MTLTPWFYTPRGDLPCPLDGSFCAYPCFKLVPARQDIRMSDKTLARVLGVGRSTWWRYRTGAQQPPRAVCGLLAVFSGVLPWRDWHGFQVNPGNGRLFPPGFRDGYTAVEVRAYWWLRQEVRVLRQERERRRPAKPVLGIQGRLTRDTPRAAGAGVSLGLVYAWDKREMKGTKLTPLPVKSLKSWDKDLVAQLTFRPLVRTGGGSHSRLQVNNRS